MATTDQRVSNQEVRHILNVAGRLTTRSVVSQATLLGTGVTDHTDTEALEVGDLSVANLTTNEIAATKVDTQELTADAAEIEDFDVDVAAVSTATLSSGQSSALTVTGWTTTDYTLQNDLTSTQVVSAVLDSVTDIVAAGVTAVPWPAGVALAEVEATGGGGGGGGEGGLNIDAGGGGGSSGYAHFWITPAQIATYTGLSVDIGTGGAGGVGTNNGGTGTPTLITLDGGAPLLVCTCPGGFGGRHGNFYGRSGPPGAAPTLVSVTGYSLIGRYGNVGRDSGTVRLVPGGSGADGRLGPGGRGANNAAVGPAVAGAFGGGGGGGASGVPYTGAAGGDGRCIIRWYKYE